MPDVTLGAWAYPLIGALIGLIGGGVFWLSHFAGLSGMIAAGLALTAMILSTGAFHEDGLADCWDGLGGGLTRERKFEIMKDSRLGTFGAAALVLSLGLRWAALSEMAGLSGFLALIVVGAVSRSVILGMLMTTRQADRQGHETLATRPTPLRLGVGFILTLLIGLALLPPFAVAGLALWGVIVVLFWRALLLRQLGGYTGDALGASQQYAEIGGLILVSLVLI